MGSPVTGCEKNIANHSREIGIVKIESRLITPDRASVPPPRLASKERTRTWGTRLRSAHQPRSDGYNVLMDHS